MANTDRIYFARRAAEEQERAVAASDPHVAETHRRLQPPYLERASTGEPTPGGVRWALIFPAEAFEGLLVKRGSGF